MKNYDIGVGWPVQFFEDGTPQTAPHPAFVSYAHKNGMIDLVVFDRYGGDARPRKSVRHIDDPALESNPVIRLEDGAWDFIPGFPEPPEKIDPVKNSAGRAIRAQNMEEFACLMAAQEVGEADYDKISKKLRTAGWTKARVQSFLESCEFFETD